VAMVNRKDGTTGNEHLRRHSEICDKGKSDGGENAYDAVKIKNILRRRRQKWTKKSGGFSVSCVRLFSYETRSYSDRAMWRSRIMTQSVTHP